MCKIPLLFSMLLLVALLNSCRQTDLFEKNIMIPGYSWNKQFSPAATFTISDTSSYYNVYLVLRHTDYYPHNNIWVELSLQMGRDTIENKKAEFSLGSDALGWEGTGINDIWELRKIIKTGWKPAKPGEYSFKLRHIMRQNPLPGVMNAGIRIEKTRNP